MNVPRLVCLIGAESTGKTTLAQSLAAHFDGLWVPEYLREFCEQKGRTPTQDEQTHILQTQRSRESEVLVLASQQGQTWVFCDTAPMLTAIYSDYFFADRSLYPLARQMHARYALTLHLCPDIPWVADGHQRDGAHVQTEVDAMITRQLVSGSSPRARVRGLHARRLEAAVQAVSALATV
jgi:nicotinamide riboside kinase